MSGPCRALRAVPAIRHSRSPMPPPGPPPPPLDASQQPLDILWRGPALLWILLAGEGLAAILALGPGIDQDRWIYFGLTSLVVQWVALLALAGLYLCRRPLRRLKPLTIAYVALAALLLSAWLTGGMMWWLLGRRFWSPDGETAALFLARLSGVAVIVGLLGVAAFQNHWRTRLMAVRAKQSELEALRARIRPHFLFNTLNSAIALVRQQPARAEHLLLDLSDLFRAALARPHDVDLAEELDMARRYLEIEAIRFGARLQATWDLPDPLPRVRLPSLSLQPIVENAVRHGIEHLPDGGTIAIRVEAGRDTATVRISNPIPVERVDSGGHSIGLNATQARVQSMTGGLGTLTSSRRGDAFVVELTLPLDRDAAA